MVCLSFRPSVRPSVQAFSWNCILSFSLFFSEIWHGARVPCFVRCRTGFSGKNFFAPKIVKMGPKFAH